MRTGRTISTAAAALAATVLLVATAGSVAASDPEGAPPGAVSGIAGVSGPEWRLCMYLGGHTTLQSGSTGEAVRHLQCILNEVYRYVNVPVNGVFEEVTKASVEHLQRQFALSVTGVVDSATWNALHP